MSTNEPTPGNSENICDFKIINRGKGQVLLRAGHQYHIKRRNKSGTIVWECAIRKKSQCNGSLTAKDNTILKENSHNHAPDFAKNDVDEVLCTCKEKINLDASQAIPTLYINSMVSLEDAGLNLIEKIPSFSSIKSSLYRKRNKAAGVIKLAHTNVSDVEVPPKFESFLMADYNYNGTRILVFCSNHTKAVLSKIKDYFADGTFKSCPYPFEQLYTIHGDLDSERLGTNIVPLFYSLMSNRTQESYCLLFQLIKSQCPDFEPMSFKTDYEKAAMSAISKNFPSTQIKGCYYHYRKCIWKKGERLNLTKSKILRRQVALSAVLPLLPEDKIMSGWFYIAEESPDDDSSKKFRKYMLRNWLQKDFYKIWCVFGLRHRTTNFLEGWHHKINRLVGKKPNLLQLLESLKNDSCFYHTKSKRIEIGVQNKRKQKSILTDDYIQDCQTQLLNGKISVGHFLEKMR